MNFQRMLDAIDGAYKEGPMHVLFLTSTLPRFEGDMQANFVREQADAWLAARPGDSITILAPHDPAAPRSEQHGRLSIERFSYFRPEKWQGLAYPAILPNLKRNPLLAAQIAPFLLSQYMHAKRLVAERQIDLVYAHWVMPQGLVAHRLKRQLGIPYILQTHSSDLAVFDRLGGLGRATARAILRDAKRFFCVNSGQLDLSLGYLEEAEGEAFRAKSAVLPMGVAKLVETSPSDQSIDIGTMGRLSRKKGLNYLIEAAEKLASRGVKPSIAIAGDGEDLGALRKMVAQSDVRFPGFLVGEKKDAFLASCARFAFPARAAGGDVEGLPVALLEALMRGQPVLASRDTNIELLPEWESIKDDIVFVEDPADVSALAAGLETLMSRQPGSAGRSAQILSRYRWEKLIEEYLAPIEAAMDR